MTARTLAAVALLSASWALAADPPPGAPTPAPSATPEATPAPAPVDARPRHEGSGPAPAALPPAARTFSGTVQRIEVNPRRLVVDGSDGPVEVVVDRNTAIYTESGTGTLRDVHPGVPVRVSATTPDQHALWVEVVHPESSPATPPPMLTRPAPADSGASGSGAASGGPAPAPPVSPALPPRAPPASPPGPGPVPGGPVGPDPTTGTAPAH